MDLTDLKGIINMMQRSDLTELEIEVQDLKLRLARPNPGGAPVVTHLAPAAVAPAPASPAAPSAPAEAPSPQDEESLFKSPMVGTFYRKPSPDDASFVDSGSKVQPGDVLCIIEAMKVMNEIKADRAGIIDEILVEDATSVEYGQPLFRIT